MQLSSPSSVLLPCPLPPGVCIGAWQTLQLQQPHKHYVELNAWYKSKRELPVPLSNSDEYTMQTTCHLDMIIVIHICMLVFCKDLVSTI